MNFLDSLTGIVIGDNNRVMRTTNGGLTWLTQAIDLLRAIKPDLQDMVWISRDTGIAVGEFGGYYKTTNAGLTWYDPHVGFVNTNQYSITAGPGDTLLMVCDSTIWLSPDHGTSWTIDTITHGFSLGAIQFVSPNKDTGVAASATGSYPNTRYNLNFTIDGGRSWLLGLPIPKLPPPYLLIRFRSASDGYIASKSVMLHTKNAGLTWDTVFSGFAGGPEDLLWVSDSVGYLATAGPMGIYSTSDAGVTWKKDSLPLSPSDNNVSQKSINRLCKFGKTVYAVGSEYIFKLDPNAQTHSSVRQQIASTFALHPNYPNPFQASTSIEFDLPRPCMTTLTVYNAAGMVVRQISREFGSASSHSINFASESLPSGIYFYELSAGGLVERSKMILMK